MSSSHRILQTEQVHQPFSQWPRSDTVCSAPQRRHFGFGVISTVLTSDSGIKYSSLYGNGLATKRHKIHKTFMTEFPPFLLNAPAEGWPMNFQAVRTEFYLSL